MAQHIALSVFRLLLATVAVLGNTLILSVVLRSATLRTTSANFLLAQLSFANLFLGFGQGVRGISAIIFNHYGIVSYDRLFCLALGSPMVFGIHLSQTTLAAIALDRFLCVRCPVLYRRSETASIALTRFCICLAYSVLGTVGSYLGVPANQTVSVCSTSAVITPWYSSYWFSFATVFTVFIYVAYIAIYVLFTRQTSSSYGNSSTQRSLFVTMTAVLVSYFICWCIPNVLTGLFRVIPVATVVRDSVGTFVGVGSGITAATNIFIYGWKHPELRRRLKRAFVGGSSTVTPVNALSHSQYSHGSHV